MHKCTKLSIVCPNGKELTFRTFLEFTHNLSVSKAGFPLWTLVLRGVCFIELPSADQIILCVQ